MADDTALGERLRQLPGVIGVAPYMDLQALAMHGSDMVPVTLRGIDPQLEAAVADIAPLLVDGKLASLAPGSNRLILGEALADAARTQRRRSGHAAGADRQRQCAARAAAARVHAWAAFSSRAWRTTTTRWCWAHSRTCGRLRPRRWARAACGCASAIALAAPAVHAGGAQQRRSRAWWCATGRRTTPTIFARCASRRP